MTRASRRLLAAAALCTVPVVALAHTNPARRSIAVQAEDHAAVVLVQWTVPSGEYGFAYGAMALWGRRGTEARDSLQATLAAKAVGPVAVTLDGVSVDVTPQVKLVEDPPRSGRLSAAVLLDVPVPDGDHELAVALRQGAETTVITGIDRSRGRATIAPAADPELLPGRPFVVRYRAAGAAHRP
ncbi:MAG TPA: hypothetical protein VMV18_06350 [bacterium]|nr:hypothetical protein [bacterium]